MPPPKPRERPKEWSLERAKQEQAKKTDFDLAPPKFGQTPGQKRRGQDGKFQKDKVK